MLSKPGRVTLRGIGKDKDGIELILDVGESVKREYGKKEVAVIPVTFLKPFPGS